METLQTIYIATAIFGAGIILVDLFGLLSHTGESDGHHDGDHADDGHAEGDHADHAESHADDYGDEEGGHHPDDKGAALMHSQVNTQRLIVRFIGLLKNVVYFAFGFGSVGWFALSTGRSVVASLLWAVAVGMLVMGVAKLVKRLQRNELDSQFKKGELLMAEAEVLVPIEKNQIGKIRVRYEGMNIDRYAKAQDPNDRFAKGDKVRVVDINDEYFFVGLV